jgi:hypothetical protein
MHLNLHVFLFVHLQYQSTCKNYVGSYIKLSDFKGHENQAPKTLEAIKIQIVVGF